MQNEPVLCQEQDEEEMKRRQESSLGNDEGGTEGMGDVVDTHFF